MVPVQTFLPERDCLSGERNCCLCTGITVSETDAGVHPLAVSADPRELP